MVGTNAKGWTMDLGTLGWAFVVIGGPILLLAVLAWGKFRNRKTSQRDPVSERGSRDLYRELNERDEKRDD